MALAVQFDHPEWLWGVVVLPVVWAIALGSPALSWQRAKVLCAFVRCGILALLVFALASPFCMSPDSGSYPVKCTLVTDCSLSIGESRDDILRKREPYESVLAQLGQISHLEFAVDAWSANEAVTPRFDGTNIEAGLNLAAGGFSSGDRGVVLLFTDGRATVGDPLLAAARLRAEGHTVHAVAIGNTRRTGPRIVGIEPPSNPRLGQPCLFLVHVRNEGRLPFDLRLVDGNGIEADRVVSAPANESVFALRCLPTEAGWQEYRVLITGTRDDKEPGEQTIASAPVFVKGPPRVLLLDTIPDEAIYLSTSLSKAGLHVSTISSSGVPSSYEEFLRYDAVIVSDCPPLDQMTQSHLERYIEEFGGGLVFIGGSNVRTAAWHDSRLERVLPITFAPEQVRAVQKPRSVHVCFVLDKSGSMEEALGVTAAGMATKLDMVKAAVHQSIAELPPEAMVSVVVFDGDTTVLVDTVSVNEWPLVAKHLDQLPADGGTVMDPAIERGIDILRKGEHRYLIVLTDGQTQLSAQVPEKQRWDELLAQMHNANISLTTVALGADADRVLLNYLASSAGGIAYECADASEVPKVFIREAQTIKQTARVNASPFRPRPGEAVAMLRGLSPASLPHLGDALAAESKKLSQVVLRTDKNTPLLAVWKRGLGTVVAFTSDAKAVWARRWITWGSYSRFWHQVVTWALRPANRIQAEVKPIVNGMDVRVLVRTMDDEGEPVRGLDARATLRSSTSSSGQQVVPLTWREIRPGVYEGRIALKDSGNHLCRLQLNSSQTCVFDHAFLVNPVGAPELAATGPDTKVLQAIASAGGGLLNPPSQEIARLIESDERQHAPSINRRDLWPVLVLMLVLLWVIDVTARRIISQRGCQLHTNMHK